MGFFHLPNQNSLRTTSSYHQIFALQLLWNVGLLGFLQMGLFIVFFILKTYQIQKFQKQGKINKSKIRQSLLSEESRQQSKRMSQRANQQGQIDQRGNQQSNSYNISSKQSLDEQQARINPNTKIFKLCNFLTSLFFYLLWIEISLVYLVFYMFGFIGRGVSHDILAVFIMTVILVVPTLVWKNYTKIQKIKSIKKQIIFTGVMLGLWVVASTLLVIGTKGACLCYYNDNYGFSVGGVNGPFMSTQWTRTNNIDKICKDNQVCNIYATVPQNSQTQVFINLHTGMNLQNITVKLISPEKKAMSSYQQNFYKMINVQDIGKRIVHAVLFKNLTANTLYRVQVYQASQYQKPNPQLLTNTNYKTTPQRNTQTLRLAMGGDVSMTVEGKVLTEKLVDYNPDAIFIGGDVTYDDGMRMCYYSWDNFYRIFDNLNKNPKINRLVPLIMSVGNHDVGFDSMATVEVNKQIQQIPLYFLFNPQHLSPDNKGNIPELQDRSTIHHHVIGPTVHLNLDSGYAQQYKTQTVDITSIGVKYSNDHYLFANYHNPIYPSCTDSKAGSNDILAIGNATKYWTPYFDQYSFIASFQHHTHHKKFTKKLKNNQVSIQNGTRYIGDGSWGVLEPSCQPERITKTPDRFQFYDTKQPNHIWLVTLDSHVQFYSINYTAIDVNGRVNFTKIQNLHVINK